MLNTVSLCQAWGVRVAGTVGVAMSRRPETFHALHGRWFQNLLFALFTNSFLSYDVRISSACIDCVVYSFCSAKKHYQNHVNVVGVNKR